MRVLDCTCGGREMWLNKDDERAVYADLRIEEPGFHGHDGRTYAVQPDVQADARELPFQDNSFDAAVYDPPHVTRGDGMDQLSGVVIKKYGALHAETWQDDLRQTFAELWRVVRDNGTVAFKFADVNVDFEKVIRLAPEPPLVGTTTNRKGNEARWYLFGVSGGDDSE